MKLIFEKCPQAHSGSLSKKCLWCLVGAATIILWGGGAHASEASNNLRELKTDRPDATESPVTVDKGHFQLESSFFSFSRDDFGETRTESWGVGESNIKYGLTDYMDFQVVFTPYVRETVRTEGVKTSKEDFSDITIRLKYNLWGNDGGPTAFGLMPVVKIPTDTDVSNGEWEGGLAIPFSWRVGEKWGFGSQVQVGRVFDEDSGDMEFEVSHTAVLGFDLFERVGVYVEYIGVAGGHHYFPFFSGGMTYGLSDMIQLDAGTLVGLSDQAEDITAFTGISWRF
ncbi:MAG: hypothetical protein M2R45_04084 [Verrucomicrobia subdivision 3 bacterium]|nr:hypothetical protein [Limisphaerales bacterium]MCS1417023.1 hypothetical protein [Limisphaerales bacterium]